MLRRRRVKRTRTGTFRVDLPTEERDLLRHLLPQLRELITGRRRTLGCAVSSRPRSPTTPRRKPSTGASCTRTSSPRGPPAIDTVEATIEAKELDEAQAAAWMTSLNSVRLVLGTMLDVSEETDVAMVGDEDPDVPAYALYAYLSLLLEELLAAADR